jgi:hypothetical protein
MYKKIQAPLESPNQQENLKTLAAMPPPPPALNAGDGVTLPSRSAIIGGAATGCLLLDIEGYSHTKDLLPTGQCRSRSHCRRGGFLLADSLLPEWRPIRCRRVRIRLPQIGQGHRRVREGASQVQPARPDRGASAVAQLGDNHAQVLQGRRWSRGISRMTASPSGATSSSPRSSARSTGPWTPSWCRRMTCT